MDKILKVEIEDAAETWVYMQEEAGDPVDYDEPMQMYLLQNVLSIRPNITLKDALKAIEHARTFMEKKKYI